MIQFAKVFLKDLYAKLRRRMPLVYTAGQASFSRLARSRFLHRTLAVELLEHRHVLSTFGLNAAPSTPDDSLNGKIAYVHAGHGYYMDNQESGVWRFQRPELYEMIEDLGNQDQMTLLVDYLFRAGATVVPLRPVGHQPNEVVLDNTDARVSFQGQWSVSNGTTYFGDVSAPYRFTTSSLEETAVARYRPNIEVAGYYPIYAWTPSGGNRAPDQLYRVHHAGGETEITVDHRKVGNGLIYLGSYYFAEGTNGYVDVSNRSSDPGKAIIADMIRFGNGMGDFDSGDGVSGRTREDEMALYWIEWHAQRAGGVPQSAYRVSSNDFSSRVAAAPLYAAFMNREAEGVLEDRVFVSFHSNASGGSGTARGVVALWNNGSGSNTATPNQLLLARYLGEEVNDDLVSLNGSFEHNWASRASNVLGGSFGEISNGRIDSEFDATIVETGYHDNEQDAEMLRDPRVRDAIARATYQGIVRYFKAVDPAVPLTFAPTSVSGVFAVSDNPGEVRVGWSVPTASDAFGDQATGYRIFVSTDGYSFDGGMEVLGGTRSSHLFQNLDPALTYYFKVVATNAAGSSPDSQVVAAKPAEAEYRVLIVNGFDRLSRSLNPREPFGVGNEVDRVRPRESNSGDYVITVAGAIQREATTLNVATASNESIISQTVELDDFDAVVWMSGEESTADSTFSVSEQALVSNYVEQGGNLFASGAEIGWDLVARNNGPSFFTDVLRADYIADDANTYLATGAGLLDGLDLAFDDGRMFYDVNYADVISPRSGAVQIAIYQTGGTAGIYAAGLGQMGDVALIGFPIESVLAAPVRDTTVKQILSAFGLPTKSDTQSSYIIDDQNASPKFAIEGPWVEVADATSQGGSHRIASSGQAATATWQFDLAEYGEAEVFVSWGDAATAHWAQYSLDTGLGVQTIAVDQRTAAGQWYSLGTHPMAAGVRRLTLTTAGLDEGEIVSADAAKLLLKSSRLASADFNNDGSTDIADYTVWRDHLGTTSVRGNGADADGSGYVDTGDYLVWKGQFGGTAQQPSQAATTADGVEDSASDSPRVSVVEISGTPVLSLRHQSPEIRARYWRGATELAIAEFEFPQAFGKVVDSRIDCMKQHDCGMPQPTAVDMLRDEALETWFIESLKASWEGLGETLREKETLFRLGG